MPMRLILPVPCSRMVRSHRSIALRLGWGRGTPLTAPSYVGPAAGPSLAAGGARWDTAGGGGSGGRQRSWLDDGLVTLEAHQGAATGAVGDRTGDQAQRPSASSRSW